MDLQIENIKEIMDGLDLAALFPKLETLLDWARALGRTAILAGPVLVLIFGLIYLLIPPKEATYRAGYRCRWGMGSQEAWCFAQKLAGIVWTSLGGALTLVMGILWILYAKLPLEELLWNTVKCLLWQGGLVLLSVWAVNITLMLRYDLNGSRRGSVKEIIGL